MEKSQLVNLIVKTMEQEGFKVYTDFKTSQAIIDIYGVLHTILGDFGVAVACKNYDKNWDVGIDTLKEMEMIGKTLKSSKVVIVTNSTFSSQAENYALRKSIKLIDGKSVLSIANKIKYSNQIDDIPKNDDEYLYNEETQDIEKNNDNLNSLNKNILKNKSKSYSLNQKTRYTGKKNSNVELRKNNDSERYIISAKNKPLRRDNKNLNRKIIHKNNSQKGNLRKSLTNDTNKSVLKSSSTKENKSFNINLKNLLDHTAILIALVVILSYLISYIVGAITIQSGGINGIVKILSSLILSFVLALVFNNGKHTNILFRGTTIFFVSLFILILLIIYT